MSGPAPSEFLRATAILDWQAPEVLALASQLAAGAGDDEAIARRCFCWVRDEIRPSHDFRLPTVTCTAYLPDHPPVVSLNPLPVF